MDLANIIRIAGRVVDTALRISREVNRSNSGARHSSRRNTASTSSNAAASQVVRGDFDGCPRMNYRATLVDGHKAGEIVWAWIPFEEDSSQGKDRPSLVIADDGADLLVTPATSKDHDRDEAQEMRAGRYWMDIGTGDWDTKRRPSEVRLDRIVRVAPSAIRRRSGRISTGVFNQVADGIRKHWDD